MRDPSSSNDPSARGAAMLRGEPQARERNPAWRRDPHADPTLQPRQPMWMHKYFECAKLAIAEDVFLESGIRNDPDFGKNWSKADWENYHRQAGGGVIQDYAINALGELAMALVDEPEARSYLAACGVTLTRATPPARVFKAGVPPFGAFRASHVLSIGGTPIEHSADAGRAFQAFLAREKIVELPDECVSGASYNGITVKDFEPGGRMAEVQGAQ